MTTRRNFLTTTSLGVLGVAQRPGQRHLFPVIPSLTSHAGRRTMQNAVSRNIPDDTVIRTLANRALDAAKSAGASYADVRLTHTRFRDLYVGSVEESLGIGVRALVNDCWGFASGPLWTPDEAARLGQGAAAQARANALGQSHPMPLAFTPAVQGEWRTPMVEDPFDVSFQETRDVIAGLLAQVSAMPCPIENFTTDRLNFQFESHAQRRTVASSDGSYFTQTYFATGGVIQGSWHFNYDAGAGRTGGGRWDVGPKLRQGGWEVISRFPWREQMLEQLAQWNERIKLPERPVDVGRYTVVFTAQAMAALLRTTLAPATQLDRVLGYEANATGTSYLGPDPMTVLGTQVAAPIVTLVGERSLPGALGTTKWDDDGVAPEPFSIIRDGGLVDYQTTRALSNVLEPWYTKQHTPVRSRGCANAENAEAITMLHAPNLVLQPNSVEDVRLTDLISSVPNGLLVDTAEKVTADHQCLNGGGPIGAQVIRGGRIVANLGSEVGMLFRTPELWKNITAIGGPSSAVIRHSCTEEKGEPVQRTQYGISAVPAIVKNVTIINTTLRA